MATIETVNGYDIDADASLEVFPILWYIEPKESMFVIFVADVRTMSDGFWRTCLS
jgi:hypothetical protein